MYKQISSKNKIEGLAQSVLNMVVTTFMDREACLDSILVYVQIQIKMERGEGPKSRFEPPPPSVLNKNKSYHRMLLQAGKASLSANAPACVAVWGWGGRAGCVQTWARPASGIAPDPGG